MNSIIGIIQEIKPEIDFAGCDNFVETGILDSFDILVLVAALDENYHISIDGTDIIPENFCSIESIMQMIGKYREIE